MFVYNYTHKRAVSADANSHGHEAATVLKQGGEGGNEDSSGIEGANEGPSDVKGSDEGPRFSRLFWRR